MKLTQSTTTRSVLFDTPTITQADSFVCATATMSRVLTFKTDIK